jgi:hypothetical protein
MGQINFLVAGVLNKFVEFCVSRMFIIVFTTSHNYVRHGGDYEELCLWDVTPCGYFFAACVGF